MIRILVQMPLLALLIAALLAGCGRKGPLEVPPPPGAAVEETVEVPPAAPRPDRRFVLDPLIQANPNP